MVSSVFLKKSADSFIKRKHPWIFSGAIEKVEGNPANGETIQIFSSNKTLVGVGSYSPSSQIRVRVWSFNPEEKIDKDFFRKKFLAASQFRKRIVDTSQTNAYRIINSENDGLPGLIVDRYADYLICQFLSSGSDFHKKIITETLDEVFNPIGIYERSDVEIRIKEGLEPTKGTLSGKEPDDLIQILENGLKFSVDVKNGHKTGFYLDQRDNRKLVSEFSRGKNVLNCFSYTGGFSVYALSSGAKNLTQIEASESALDLSTKNIELNNPDDSKIENISGDVFEVLRKFRDERRTFDLIILDPPKFAESESQIQKASRGYKDINLLAIKLLNPGGILFTFSCSGHISQELFQKIVADAALDSGREVKIIKQLTQAADHPVALNFPEGLYLKGLICCAN
ncbi:MAG: 23S rRNA (cytosine(1962)-C(5))-methyltransferase RlmI [Ignavibacteriota bacterium]|nr:MAG: 23S rRNA (cytosine(1962)-C(5))-methyltransferase RlmI [Chlorobiota bacterium]MBE7475983.1 class I SAM-dependent methyltransferase [Ignavibacteriales bacterium]MBL1123209.1 23S rRNA (cytosine(1962)-C(5))-methyltransferase RlmI [Ignavibacteriota bacterium]MCE7856838.1 23S rRNA (cytosine(1962)-C(5))-methyltransferase RlmI [Ignavibacteria bacterium CHB3]QKJ97911.1 MAG: 23S rRNA (cytosine(1962)-C(5))-methyltransferase RlmI [Ignavibacteriota bacterium]